MRLLADLFQPLDITALNVMVPWLKNNFKRFYTLSMLFTGHFKKLFIWQVLKSKVIIFLTEF